jgi:sugar/nucleoside kinase (ribokinase family)
MTEFDLTVAGEVNLDLILYGLDTNIPVDREILASGFEMTLGSSSAILAHNISFLGVSVGFVTHCGDDEMGRIAMERLAETHVDLSRCRAMANAKTGVTILLPHGRSRRILTFPGAMFEMSVADLDVDYLCSAGHFHLSSLFLQKGLHSGLPDLFRTMKRRGLTLSLDTNDDPEGLWGSPLDEILPLIDILLPNDEEVCKIARKPTVDEALDALSMQVPTIAVKCGAQGAIVQQGSHRFQVPGIHVDPVDTIGAGDSFNAGFLAAWLRGSKPEICAKAGNISGALSTQRPGGTEAFRDGQLRESFLDKWGFPL